VSASASDGAESKLAPAGIGIVASRDQSGADARERRICPLMIVCATLSHYFIERPCSHLGKRIVATRRVNASRSSSG
jgi:hypothetical protein